MRWLVAGICALGIAAHLGAATLSRLSMADMVNQSTAIVHVRIGSSYSAFRGSTIYTWYQAQVLDTWKGPSQASVSVALPGGTANGYRQSFDGTPQLIAGQEYVLFLWTSPSGLTQIIGLTQGLFHVSGDAQTGLTATRLATSNTLLDAVTGKVVKDQALEMSLGTLTRQIAATLGKAASQ